MTELQQRNKAFLDFLGTLNTAQRAAVEKTEGPTLVIAGPGTGKTHILAARIGNILLNTDARAQNILCLTFTDAGANAMRKRLATQIGPEAHRVPIYTFHGFCNRVIQENTELFGSGDLEPLTDLERIEIVRELMTKLPVDNPLRAGYKDVFQFETQLRNLFSNMKKEGWTPGLVLKKTNEFLHGLPTNPSYIYQKKAGRAEKGDPKWAEIEAITAKLERLKSAADLFPKYQTALETAGRYEYEDMLLWVNRAFQKNEALLRTYQERYQYILVDEFQDTNGAQFNLLVQLLNFWDIPNIFIVGDDDQSIYEFQGARLANLLNFSQRYRDGLEIIVLEENYRSTQGILDAATSVVALNNLRAVAQLDGLQDKTLQAHTRQASQPILRIYPNRLHELTDIADRIAEMIASGVEPSDIAVLYSLHKQARPLQLLLGKKGIPFQTKRPVNILEIPNVAHFRDLLRYLQEELALPFSGEHRLFRLFHADFLELNTLDLAILAAKSSEHRRTQPRNLQEYPSEDTLEKQHPDNTLHWRTMLSDESLLLSLPLTQPRALTSIGRLLNRWIAAAANLPLPQLIELLYNQTGLLDWTLHHEDNVWHLQVLHTFLNAVPPPEKNRRVTRNQDESDLGYFLQMLDSMERNNLPLPLRQPIATEPGVQLLTAHAAKGLEFEHVFLFDCVDVAWENNPGNTRSQFTLPPTLTLSGEEDALEARRRLFYVAMTRAKRGLYISCAQLEDDEKKSLTPSRFLDETLLPTINITVATDRLLETQTMLLLQAPKTILNLPEKAVVDALLEQFSMSINALNRYLRCPLAFWYEDILKVPGTMSEAAAYGKAMHGALHHFFDAMKIEQSFQWPGIAQLWNMFALEMDQLKHHFSEHSFTQKMALGNEYLRRIHLEQIPFWRKRAVVERKIDNVTFEGVPLTGRLDKIEWIDHHGLRIVDYKTSKPETSKTAAPNDHQPLGSIYWRQLAFYQILVENAGIYPEKVEKTAISWLEPDKKGNFPITEIIFSPDDISFVGTLIKDTYTKIQHREFSAGCGQDDCTWCKMHRDRNLKEAPPRTNEEGLDDPS
jgi:DNA helicase-2/ATP-dependent DNA helicase PcrA